MSIKSRLQKLESKEQEHNKIPRIAALHDTKLTRQASPDVYTTYGLSESEINALRQDLSNRYDLIIQVVRESPEPPDLLINPH